jgi:aldose sugar dehydrogenase
VDTSYGSYFQKQRIEDELVNFPGSKYTDPVFSWVPSTGITDIEFLNPSKLGEKYANNIFVGDNGAATV